MITILTRKPWVIFFVANMACGSSSPLPASESREPSSAGLVVDASPPDVRSGISEVEARELLDGMFRDAGLRVVNDVAWTGEAIEVTLDGYDPERQVGYEYVAHAEAGAELDALELRALDLHEHILLARPCSHAELERLAALFLASLSPAQTSGAPSDDPDDP